MSDFSDVEALRLMRAFNQINDPNTRRTVLGMVEVLARYAKVEVEKPDQEIDLPELDVPVPSRSWLEMRVA